MPSFSCKFQTILSVRGRLRLRISNTRFDPPIAGVKFIGRFFVDSNSQHHSRSSFCASYPRFLITSNTQQGKRKARELAAPQRSRAQGFVITKRQGCARRKCWNVRTDPGGLGGSGPRRLLTAEVARVSTRRQRCPRRKCWNVGTDPGVGYPGVGWAGSVRLAL